jgi:uncharacterized protein (DUF885 family)
MESNPVPRQFIRRDFLKIALTYGEMLLLFPLLESCERVPSAMPTLRPSVTATLSPAVQPPISSATSTSTATSTEMADPLTAGLQDLDIERFLDESIKRLFLRDPETVTINGISGLLGVRNDQLTNVSDAYIGETQRLQTGILDLLKKYNPGSFTESQLLNASLYRWYLEDLMRQFPYMYNDYQVTPFVNSLNWNLQFLFTEAQPVADLQDVQDYISRLLQVSTKFEQVIDGLQRRKDFGVILPRIIIPDLLNDLRQYTQMVESHPYYLAYSSKVNQITSIISTDRQELASQAKQAITQNVIPAYTSLSDFFRAVESAAPNDVGVWRYSNGEAYYAYLLKHYTTTDLTAEEIHQLGLNNIERIDGEMREVLATLGYTSSESLGSLMKSFFAGTEFIAGERATAAYQAAIDQATAMLDQAFDMKLEVPIAVVGGNQGNYFTPAPRDGSRPPTFNALTSYNQPRYQIKDIAFHEAVPGHGYQFDIVRQLNLPLFRDALQFDSYVEGWALYAERLMWELGAYEDDPVGNLGRLSLELLRAARCVIDTGIHSKRWSFSKAKQYMADTAGTPGEGEVRRYIMLPAQATSYYVGYQQILELRQKAKDRLGDRFDLKKFHHVILANGPLPLEMLAGQVAEYIAA